MIHFIVSVVTENGAHEYPAIAAHWFDLYLAANEEFGICKFSARPA